MLLVGVLLLNGLGILETKEREEMSDVKKGTDEKPKVQKRGLSATPTGYNPKSKAHMKWEQEVNFEKAKQVHSKGEMERANRENKEMDRERERQRLSKMKRGAQRRETARTEAKRAKAEAKKRAKEDAAEKKKEEEEKKKEEEAGAEGDNDLGF